MRPRALKRFKQFLPDSFSGRFRDKICIPRQSLVCFRINGEAKRSRQTIGSKQSYWVFAKNIVGDHADFLGCQIPQAAGPGLAGALLDAGQLALPFYAAAVLQAVYLLLYQHAFREHEPTREEKITDSDGKNTRGREQIQAGGSDNKIWGAHD